MQKIFWAFAYTILRTLKVENLIRLFFSKSSFLIESGWLKSAILKKSVNRDKEPIPWLSYGAIHFLEPRLSKELSIFEFGCGHSTIWFANKVKDIISLEHNSHWYEAIKKQLPANARLELCTLNGDPPLSETAFMSRENESSYARYPLILNQKFDIVVVDGVDRNNCIINAVDILKEGGVFIIDNTDQKNAKNYHDGLSFLKSKGFKNLDFYGMCPIVSKLTCTSVYYRSQNCLGI